MRTTFSAELADPYAAPDDALVAPTEAVLQVLADVMLTTTANEIPDQDSAKAIQAAAGSQKSGVASSLAYLRDRIGVPRDLPLASARYLRAYLNWAIDMLEDE